MGRKWTNIKFDIREPQTTIQEASSRPRTRKKVVDDFIRTEWSEENIPHSKKVDVMFGNLDEDKLKRYIDKFFSRFDFIKRAAAVYVTDSAHIGYGWVFKSKGNSGVLLETYTGYEGAKGNDVAGRISDDYNITVNPDWFWD